MREWEKYSGVEEGTGTGSSFHQMKPEEGSMRKEKHVTVAVRL